MSHLKLTVTTMPTPLPYRPGSSPGPPQSISNTQKTLPKNKARPFVVAVSIAAVTIMGTLYGASLKQETQSAKKQEKRAEESLARKMERLQMASDRLQTTRTGLERKIAELRKRREDRVVQRGGGKEV